jgi:hypothetical protein
MATSSAVITGASLWTELPSFGHVFPELGDAIEDRPGGAYQQATPATILSFQGNAFLWKAPALRQTRINASGHP